uniref:Beaded filament structural protein 2, phakinin n=1 Tax=Sphaeramia orbicularis TaxID=375764 RepID=A0A673AME1_9TELE
MRNKGPVAAEHQQHETKRRCSRTTPSHKSGCAALSAVCHIMPLPRRRSSFLGQPSCERSASSSCGRVTSSVTGAPRGVYVGSAPLMGGASGLGTRGMRSVSAPVVPRAGERTAVRAAVVAERAVLTADGVQDKVRALEQLNQQLEEQIRLASTAKSVLPPAGCSCSQHCVFLQVSEAILDNARLMLQTENVQANAEDFKDRYENEQPFRKAVEEEISSLYKVIDDANLTKAELEEQMENMRVELRSLEQNHEQDVRVLYSQMSGREVDEPDAPIETSLDQILAYIRNHWEKVTERNRAETDSYLDCKVRTGSTKQVEALKAECSDAGAKIQSLQAEIESMRALKRGLENSQSDARHWHDMELQNLGSVVAKLEAELGDIRGEIEQQRRDYDTLLSNKQRLEQEIGMYHGILDGENRFQPAEPS